MIYQNFNKLSIASSMLIEICFFASSNQNSSFRFQHFSNATDSVKCMLPVVDLIIVNVKNDKQFYLQLDNKKIRI